MYSDQERGSDLTKKGQSGGGGHYQRETAGSTLVLRREWEMACCAGSPEGRNCKCHETPEDNGKIAGLRWWILADGTQVPWVLEDEDTVLTWILGGSDTRTSVNSGNDGIVCHGSRR